MKKSKIINGLLMAVITCIALLFVGIQVFRYAYTPVKTETAYVYTQSDFVSAKGIAIRNEAIIEKPAEGIKSYLYDDGDKVSKGIEIAKIYESEQDAANEAEMRQLTSEIDMLKQSQDPGRAGFANAEILGKHITEMLGHILDTADSGDLSKISEQKNEYLLLLNTRQVATNIVTGFDDRITELQSRISSLSDATQPAKAVVTAPGSGFFVSTLDGFENKLSVDMLETVSLSEFNALLDNKPDNTAGTGSVGKLITDFEWYFAAPVENEKLGRFITGAAVTLTFPYISDEKYPATVQQVVQKEGESSAIVTIKCDRMSKELADIRVEQVEISFRNFTGIKVKSTVTRFNKDGEMGVYIKVGENIEFRKLDVIYKGDGFVLSKVHEGDKGYLQLFDSVIIKGKDLSEHALE